MKRILQTLLIALLVTGIAPVSFAAAKKPKTEGKKKLVPAASAQPDQQPAEKPAARTESSLPYIPSIPAIQTLSEEDESDPDLPQHLQGKIDKAEYLRLRDEYIGILRGLDPNFPFDVSRRSEAIKQMEGQILSRPVSNLPTDPTWFPLGPSPVPNGQTQQFPTTAPVSGRATCVVVDPTNSNKVYLGTAQGGVWRTTNGGATWIPIFDFAQSLAIGALAIAPSNPTILYVGTGEPNNSADSYFGVGVYRIDNADTTADLVGPINPVSVTGTTTQITTNCFTGRAISKILVNPVDPAIIYVSTAAAVSGAAGNALSNLVPPLGLRGVYRSTNATADAASVTFQKLIVNTDGSLDSPGTGNTSIFDMVLEPGNPNNLLVSTSGTSTGGVIMRSTNALAATPTFTQVLFPGFNGLVMHLAINSVGGVVTVYVASNEPSTVTACSSVGQAGRVRKSVNGGVTWSAPLSAAEGYCGGQCSYDNPIGVDPNDANIVYIGGNARGTCSAVLKRSSDGGTTFTTDDNGLHADSHGITMDANTVPTTVWFVNDGGVWKRPDATAGTPWLNQNTGGLNTIQFVGMAVHPTNPFLTIGGTQDNGTEAMTLSKGNWNSAESGDGGFALIDGSSTDTTNVTMYHTFFNQTNNLIGFDRTNVGTCLPPPASNKDSWEFRGAGVTADPTLSCDGTAFALANGITLSDTVLFYAPMALGPGGAGNSNTLYFGTNKLYRSTNRGDVMTIASQSPIVAGVAISAIGICPTNDNIRIVGLRNGNVFATTTGSTTLTNTSFPFPTNATASTTNRHVSRAVIDPLNSNTAYVTLAYYTNPATAGQIWRTTNLNGAPPTWTSIGNTATGFPNVPVNGFVADGNDPTHPGVTVLYAGTDIGVFASTDSGATWNPFGNPVLPRVAVFDLVLQPSSRILRAATHGRGAWQAVLPGGCDSPATPTITPSGPTTFCAGGSVTLTSSSAVGNQWYLNGSPIAGAMAQTYFVTGAGDYTVQVTIAGCASPVSAVTTVTVNPLPPAPVITAGGPTTFCAGGSVTLTSDSASGNQWYLNGNAIAGATNQSYVAMASGNYTDKVTDGNSCVSAPSNTISVTVNPPTPAITAGGPTTFCAGGSVTLTSDSATGNQWYLNDNPIAGATNQSYVATASGNYTDKVTDGNSCVSPPSNTISVTVNPLPPAPTISTGGPTTFCGSGTLTSSSATGNTWYLNGSLIPGATGQQYVATMSGDYTVRFTDGNGCFATSAPTTVTINPIPDKPTISPSGSVTFCYRDSVTLTSSSPTGNQWYFEGSPIQGATNQTLVVTKNMIGFAVDNGAHFTVVVTENGCSSPSSDATFAAYLLPVTPSITAAGPTTFCAGGSVQLNVTQDVPGQWYRDGTLITDATGRSYTATLSGTYTFVNTFYPSCPSDPSNGITVTANPLPETPIITAEGPTTFCFGGSVTLTSSSATGNQWYLNGNLIADATNQTYPATISGNYTVRVTDGNGCFSTSTATPVTVNPLPDTPTITAGGPTTFCFGGSVTLTSSSATGNQWYLNGNLIADATNQTYPATVSGNYTVRVTDGNGCFATSTATPVTVNPPPQTPTITAGGPTTFCAGGSVTLTSSSATGNQWYLNGNAIGGATNQAYVASVSGNYTVQVGDGNGCMSAVSAATPVTVNPLPATPTITPGGPTTFCDGGSVTLTSSSATGNQWYVNDDPIPTATSQTYAATVSGNYTVRVTDGNGCMSALSAATPVIVNPLPATPTITPNGPTTFCAGGSVTLTSSSATGNQWYLNGNAIGGATNQAYVATASGNYTVQVGDGNGCMSAVSAATSVTVNPLPATPTITPGGPTTFCAGGSVMLTSSSATGNQWYLNGNPIGGASNQAYVATVSGNYTVRVTDGNGCMSAPSAATPVIVNPLPATPTITPGGPITFCAGGSVTLTSSSATGNQWYLNGNAIGGATNQTFVSSASGNYTVQVTDGNGCMSAVSAATSVTVNPLPATPTITPGGPTTFCDGGSVTLTSSSATGNQWYVNGDPIATATNQTYVAMVSGNYTVKVTDGNGCTSAASDATPVTVNPIPATPVATNDGPYVVGNTIHLFTATVSGASYAWTGPAGFTSTAQNPSIAAATIANNGTYSVRITVNGCTSQPGSTQVVVTATAPTAVVATATTTTSVLVTWQASAGASSYEILRRGAVGGYGVVGTTVSTQFVDGTAEATHAYLYLVRAVDSNLNRSPNSAVDLATTVIFAPITPNLTPIRASDFDDLRHATNAVRELAGHADATFTDPSLIGVTVKKVHIDELRAALDEARSALLLSANPYAEAITGNTTPVRASHAIELRNGVQ